MSKILRKITALLILASMLASILASCATGKNNNNSSGSNNNSSGNNSGDNSNTDTPSGVLKGEDVPSDTEGMIFNSESTLNIILADESLASSVYVDFVWGMKDNLGDRVSVHYSDENDPAEHEVIFGKSNRVVSHMAYSQLEVLLEDKDPAIGGYVLYSDGSSLALAYTEEIGSQHLTEIAAILADFAGYKSLVKTRGVVSSKLYDMYAIYAEEDKAYRDDEWAALEKQVGKELTDAFKDFYKMLYSDGIVSWLANLYEPRECVCDNYVNGVQVCLHPVDKNGNDLCKNGGFYYSNSARNTIGFLPDVESTYQALTFLEMTGMLDRAGGNFGAFLKGQLRSDIVAFTKGLQHEDGYFYHPQWTVEQSRENWARVSRDLMWATSILSKCSANPYYTTPTGSMVGSGGRPKPASSLLTGKISGSSAESVSALVQTAAALPDHLLSVEAFQKYLSKFKMDVYGMGYAAANELAAQVDQLTTANKRLNGALKPVLFEWFEEKHRSDNGLWRPEVDYDGLNTVFKAIMVYSAFKVSFPYAEQAAQSALTVLASEELPGHVCGDYNTWYDIKGLIGNIRAYHPDPNRGEIANEILEKVREIAPMAVRKTAENTARFKKVDGSFSYFPDHCSETSQGMVVALRKDEGDVNASLICSGGMLDHMSMALNVSLPSIFGMRELAMFVDIINDNTFSVKDALPPDVIFNFEEDDIDVEPKGVGYATASGGSAVVVADPYNPSNKVLHFQSLAKSGTWDAITIPNNTVKANNNCLVYDAKLMFAKEGTSQGYLIQMYIGYMNKPSPYFINFTVAGDYVEVWEASSDTFQNSFDRLLGRFLLDEWFKLRVEYYFGYEDVENGLTPHDTVRIKVYINDKLIAVSSNYMDNSMGKFIEGTGTPTDEAKQALFFPMSYLACNMYFDDVYLGYKTIEYKNEKNTEGLLINEDADAERKIYDLDEGAPEDFTISGATTKLDFADGAMNFKSVDGEVTVEIPALNRKTHPNVFSIGYDIKIDSATEGNVFTLALKDPDKGATIVSYTMRAVKTEAGLVLAPIYKGTTVISSAAIPVDGSLHHIEFAFFVDQATTLIYLDGEMIASTEQGVTAKCFLYEMGNAVITYSRKMTATIDNIYCERRVMSFADEVKPKVDRNLYDFSQGSLSEIEGIKTNGTLANGRLSLLGNKYVTIPVNNRAAYVSAHQLSLNIELRNSASEETIYVKYIDAEGKTIVGLVISIKDEVALFYEMMNDVAVGDYIGSCKFKGAGNLLFNLYGNEKALEAYLNDEIILVTNVFNSAEYGEVAAATVTAQNISVDDMYFDGLTITYTAPSVEGSTKDDTDEVITYEYSSIGNYPNRITAQNSTIQNSTIEYAERDGKLTKVFVLNKIVDSYSNGVNVAFADGKTHSSFVFETDMKLTGTLAAGGWRSTVTFYFANQSGGTHLFVMNLRIVDGRLWVVRADNTLVDLGTVVPEDGWFNVRVEAEAGDRSTDPNTGAKFALYINNVAVYTDNTVYHTNTGSIYQVLIQPTSGGTGTMYLDNTVLKIPD